ncbi:MAG TPA: hypothetical protein VFI31_11450 [Pirellulales bacterium]|nr:hypothetical protein [Pirellulales bacterium]
MKTFTICCVLWASVTSAVAPLPDKAKIEAAAKIVRDTYRKEIGSEQGLVKVLEAADSTNDDPAGQAAMYLSVRDEFSNGPPLTGDETGHRYKTFGLRVAADLR